MKQLKLFVFACILFFTASSSFPQQHPNSIYLEVLGSGGLYSVNYDRLISPNFGARIGISYFAFEADDFFFPTVNAFLFPMSLNFFIGSGSSKLEVGDGLAGALME